MNRGRSYRQVPMARKRFNKRIALICLLILGLVVSITGLTVYFMQSNQNRVEQEEIAAAYMKVLKEEQAQSSVGDVLMTAPTQKSTIATMADASFSSDAAGQTSSKPFFQMIGLMRKAFKPIIKRNADAVGWITIEGLVDQPIVYRDNTFYMTHDFDQQKMYAELFSGCKRIRYTADAYHMRQVGQACAVCPQATGKRYGQEYSKGFARTLFALT